MTKEEVGRLSALVERAAAKAAADEQAAAAGEESAAPKQATRRKVSRRKLLDDLARAEARYHEAKARHDALHHSRRGLTFEQANSVSRVRKFFSDGQRRRLTGSGRLPRHCLRV